MGKLNMTCSEIGLRCQAGLNPCVVLLICKGKALTWAVFHEKRRKGEEMVMHPVMKTECILDCILDCFLEGDPSQWR